MTGDTDTGGMSKAPGFGRLVSCYWHPNHMVDRRRCVECPTQRHYCFQCLVETRNGTLCKEHAARHARTHRRRRVLSGIGVAAVVGVAAVFLLNRSPATTTSTSSTSVTIDRPPPDGVFFAENRAGNWDIFYLVYATRAEHRLTDNSAEDRDPSNNYSNVGLLLFSTNRDSGDFEIYTMERDGSDQKRLTSVVGADRYPDWSPWQTHIVFESTRDGAEELYVMSADGSGQTRITNAPGYDGQPQWTSNVRFPLGSTDDRTDIAFVSDRDRNLEIYLTKPDGSDQRRLTFSPAPDQSPTWSPDGTKIAFLSERDGNREIYVMNADGSGQTRLTHDPATDEAPAWSPSGDRISFRSDRAGEMEAYSMRPDGTDQSISPNQR